MGSRAERKARHNITEEALSEHDIRKNDESDLKLDMRKFLKVHEGREREGGLSADSQNARDEVRKNQLIKNLEGKKALIERNIAEQHEATIVDEELSRLTGEHIKHKKERAEMRRMKKEQKKEAAD